MSQALADEWGCPKPHPAVPIWLPRHFQGSPMLPRSASSVSRQQKPIPMGPLDDRGLSPPRTTAPARRLAGRGGLRSPDQFGPSRVCETIRFIRRTPPEVDAYSRLVSRTTMTSADSSRLPARVATDGAGPALAHRTACRTGLPG
jgi:hypothetical protein